MDNFNQLDEEGQIQLLRQVAQKALQPLGFAHAEITLLNHCMNTVFKVTVQDKKYVLRIAPEHWLSADTIQSEMVFLDALSASGVLGVPKPVPLGSSFLQPIQIEQLDAPRNCVCYEWVEGAVRGSYDVTDLQKAGRALAQLHEFTTSFVPPEGFTRPVMDADGLFGAGGMFDPGDGITLFSADQSQVFEQSIQKMKCELCKLQRTGDQFGLLHGDYYANNILFDNDSVGLIDFDMMGIGFFAFDIVMPYLPNAQGVEDIWKPYLAGYQRVRKLPDGIFELKSTFDAMRRLIEAYWAVARQDSPWARQYTNNMLCGSYDALKHYLDT